MDVALQVRSKADDSVQETKLLVNGTRMFAGRGPECNLLLDGQGISRHHLGIDAEDAALFITDLSSNGTWLNGKRLDQNRKSKVEDSDVIELPGYEIRVRLGPAPGAGNGLPASEREQTVAIPAASDGSSLTPLALTPPAFTPLEKLVILLVLASAALLLLYFLAS